MDRQLDHHQLVDTQLGQMDSEQKELYERIQAFPLDRIDAAFPFNRKLAKNNGWSTSYTQRVIEEYKKFVFLAVIAGHIVTPSDQVDQAWHLHLTYTRSYWEDFCPNVLQTPLHHDPTRGGSVEHLKYTNLYDRTLESYQKFFGQIPPADIWSTPKDRFGRDTNFVRVNTQQNWFVPKPSWDFLPKVPHQPALILLLLFTLTSFVAGCQGITNIPNIANFTGLEFLTFYFFLSVAVILAAWKLRWYLRLPETNPSKKNPSLDPYEIAYLAGRESRVIDTAITSLVQKKHITVSEKSISINVNSPVQKLSHPMEKAVIKAITLHGYSPKIRSAANKELGMIRDRLRQLGLFLTPSQSFKVRLYPAMLVFSLEFLGVARMLAGLLRGRPIGYLAFMCLAIAVISYCIFFEDHTSTKSRYGDQFLANLLNKKRPSILSDQEDPKLILSFALIGAVALSTTMFPELRTFFIPPASASGGSDGFEGSGDGGGGCGGGGCGGGGCGGGCGG